MMIIDELFNRFHDGARRTTLTKAEHCFSFLLLNAKCINVDV